MVSMRVCLMNDNFYRSSGVAIAIRRIAAAANNVEYCFAGCLSEGLQEDISWIPDGKYRRFDLKSSNPLQVAKELLRFRRWFKSQGCDLVHCHHRRISALLELCNITVLYTAQLAFPYETWFRWLHPEQMTAITPSVAINLLQTTGRSPIACIGNPATFPTTAPDIDIGRVGQKAICIGRLDPVKGHAHLLAAWKLLCDRGYSYELDLVGEGSLRRVLENQCVRDGTSHLIHFLGFRQDVSVLLDDCLFAILVSQNEGQGIVTIEAAASGRPSLLTAVPGSIDLIPPGIRLTNGIVFGSPTKLADALEEWFAHAEDVARDGKLFFDYLRTSSDPRKLAEDYLMTYQEVLSKP